MDELVERCDIRVGDVIGNKYTVEQQLGEGTFGKVFKVTDRPSRQPYALKLFKFWEMPADQRKGMLSRFLMEYETGQIKSNYLIHSEEYGYIKGNPYIVMEFCPNGDLLQLVNNNQHVDLLRISREILYGLKDLHSCGKVHRDLKPENVLIKADGTAVLTDFGISGDRKKKITVTDLFGRPTEITGTVIYMAPEQAKPKNREVTVLPTMDIFSFGVLIYQLITGVFPFGPLNSEDDMVLYLRYAREGKWNRTKLMEYPEGIQFDSAIAGCLHPDFKQRLQTVDNVLSLLPLPENKGQAVHRHQAGFVPQQVENGILLRIMQGEEYGSVYKLNELLHGKSKVITVGCHDQFVHNLFPVTENLTRYISRKHCTLELASDNQWIIRDGQWDRNATATNGWKNSLNGTFVNSTEISSIGMPIKQGDIISIGDVKMRVEGY
ncbi:MAG: protein kinase [Tannerella sp.]|jgi:serine/threonine protein kinase|nr:protein kinase [Tannerella sp.]